MGILIVIYLVSAIKTGRLRMWLQQPLQPKRSGFKCFPEPSSQSQRGRSDEVCAYYWQTEKGPVNDGLFDVLKGKVAGLEGFRVDMCTEVKDVSETAIASERLSEFATAVDPQVRRLLQEAIATRK